jgi:hypothetical protein
MTIGAALSHSSPFLRPWNKVTELKSQSCKTRLEKLGSDHLAIVQVYNEWAAIESVAEQRDYCQENVLSHDCLVKLSQLRDQFRQCLSDLGFCLPKEFVLNTPKKTLYDAYAQEEEESGGVKEEEEEGGPWYYYDETDYYGNDIELVRLFYISHFELNQQLFIIIIIIIVIDQLFQLFCCKKKCFIFPCICI